jgi:hypothetical protein
VTTLGIAANDPGISVEPEAVRTDHLEARLEQLELETIQLRERVSIYEEKPRDQVESDRSPHLKEISRSAAVMGMMKGRSYGTFFYGPTSAMSVVAHVSASLRSYIKVALAVAHRAGRGTPRTYINFPFAQSVVCLVYYHGGAQWLAKHY